MKVTKDQWEHIMFLMKKYNRSDGYVDFIESNQGIWKITLFDSNPKLNGISSLYVTKDDIEKIIKSY